MLIQKKLDNIKINLKKKHLSIHMDAHIFYGGSESGLLYKTNELTLTCLDSVLLILSRKVLQDSTDSNLSC